MQLWQELGYDFQVLIIFDVCKMGLLDLFIASSVHEMKVLLVTALGSYLAVDRLNILGDDARKIFKSLLLCVSVFPLVENTINSALTKFVCSDSMTKTKLRREYLYV